MNIIPVDPVNLSFKGKFFAVISCFSVILVIACFSKQLALAEYPLLIASMGASAVIVFIIPTSPLAQPWPLVGGQLISTAIGIVCAQTIPDTGYAAAYAVGGSVLVMLLLRCLHPPGAAAALSPVLSGDPITSIGYSFVLMPVAINVMVMLVLAIVINRWLLHLEYPNNSSATPDSATKSKQRMRMTEQDVQQALLNSDTFLDIAPHDLNKLLATIQQQRFKRASGPVTCADIMDNHVLTVEYGTDVEEAWHVMHREQLNSLPVIDKSKHVIGIITWHDFFKHINTQTPASFQEKLLAFIKRTPDVSTHKPESVGHIMAQPVAALMENTPIAELVTLMSTHGYRQVPIVDNQQKLVGMVYQADVMTALYSISAR